MWARAKYILLPIFGAIAAVLSFQVAAPYESTLARQGLAATDPAARFTLGTQWGEVNRIAFGCLICASFCFILSAGRKVWWKVLWSTVAGGLIGGAVNYYTDSGSDRIGIVLAHSSGILGEMVASMAWCVLVPAGIAFSITLATGPTGERVRRAFIATIIAAVSSFGAQMGVSALAAPNLMSQGLDGGLLTPGGSLNLQSQIPVWRSEAIAVGIALGFTMMVADQWARAGTLRLLLGRNEYRDWSLDHPVNRIGSSEGLEIPIWGFRQVARVHGQVVRSGIHFVFESLGMGAAINGQPIPSAVLVHGDILTLGDATLVFLARGAPRMTTAFRPEARPMPAAPSQALHHLVDATGGHFTLAPGFYEVGRDASCSIPLPNETTVSRRHATLTITPQGAQVADLGSSNGTKVNGSRISVPTALCPGDHLEFGSARFQYR